MNAAHHLDAWLAWHGRLMVLAWSILLPLGVLVARYFKVTPQQDWPRQLDNQFWWRAHLLLQISGVLCMSLAAGLAWWAGGAMSWGHSLHAALGWLVALIGWLQLVGGSLRGSKGGAFCNGASGVESSGVSAADSVAARERGDHFDMTRRRVIFEWSHKLCGYASLLLAPVVTALGLQRADAPTWMWVVIALWWALLVVAALVLQRSGRCLDTYQAIWGPEPALPGNARDIIGWGVRRYTAEGFRRQFHSRRSIPRRAAQP